MLKNSAPSDRGENLLQWLISALTAAVVSLFTTTDEIWTKVVFPSISSSVFTKVRIYITIRFAERGGVLISGASFPLFSSPSQGVNKPAGITRAVMANSSATLISCQSNNDVPNGRWREINNPWKFQNSSPMYNEWKVCFQQFPKRTQPYGSLKKLWTNGVLMN